MVSRAFFFFLVDKALNANLSVVMFPTVCHGETRGVGMGSEKKNLEKHMICKCGTKVPASHLYEVSCTLFSAHQLAFGEERKVVKDIKKTQNVSQRY